jgi:hypothetical protein
LGRHFSNTNIRGAPGFRDGWQRHHLIPQQCKTDPQTRLLMMVMIGLGFCFNDFPRNGILLPNTYAQSAIFNLPYHSGSHREYNAMVIGMMTSLTSHLNFVSDLSDAQRALSLIRHTQASLRVRMYQERPISIDKIGVPRVVRGKSSIDRAIETMLS